MLKVYNVNTAAQMDTFISNSMNLWRGWAFVQPDCDKAVYPAKFVIVTEPKIKLATIQILH